MNICVIPARGGSKRIPRKNIKLFHGKPMIAWSIEAAKASECFERIIVSTDDLEIAEVSMRFGAEVPFVRPAELADDHSSTVDVMQHAAGWVHAHNPNTRHLCCVYPTSPFLSATDLASGLATLESDSKSYVYSVTRFDFPIQRALMISEQGVTAFDPAGYARRSQDLTPMWHDAGQFYWGTIESFVEASPLLGERIGVVEIPGYRCQDIDDEADWRAAELKYAVMADQS